MLVVKLQVENIKVEPSTDSAHHRHSSDVMVGKFMPVALDNSVDSPNRELLQELAYLVVEGANTGLTGTLVPVPVGLVSITVVACMAED